MKSTKVIFLVPYPLNKAPSQRFRVELFLPSLDSAGITYSIHPFITDRTWKILYQEGAFFSKAWGIFYGFLTRWFIVLFKVPLYNYVFIHREAAPLGPPVFEWIIAKLFRKKIIYDFDDAIWIANTTSTNRMSNWLKASWKIKYECKWAYKISAGNDYLCDFARQFNQQVIKMPTCIDGEKYKLKQHHDGRVTIGWTGSHSTLKYLDELIPVIRELENEVDFDFVVIADKDPALPITNYNFVQWRADSEIQDLLQLDIGVMPLVADSWSEGKCGFKLIQYFGCAIPAVASPVGVNKIIVEEGLNGFLCDTPGDWNRALRKLIADRSLRERMGLAGRKKIMEQYSMQSNLARFEQFFS